jgi:ferritin-like metal-binding protein YciE
MTTTQDKLAHYLQDARAMEHALIRTLQAHIAMAPRGTYRDALERHLHETRSHADRIGRRLADLGRAQSMVETGYGIAQRLAAELLALSKAPIDMMRGASRQEKLLRNARDEAASEAFEIAAYDALEQLARRAGDDLTARLAADHRADEERMLETLRGEIPRLADAVVDAEVGDGQGAGAQPGGAGAGGAAGPTAAPETGRGATTTGPRQPPSGGVGTSSPPWPGYDTMNVEDVRQRLAELMPDELRNVTAYEQSHKQRRSVLDAIDRRLGEQQAPGAGDPSTAT